MRHTQSHPQVVVACRQSNLFCLVVVRSTAHRRIPFALGPSYPSLVLCPSPWKGGVKESTYAGELNAIVDSLWSTHTRCIVHTWTLYFTTISVVVFLCNVLLVLNWSKFSYMSCLCLCVEFCGIFASASCMFVDRFRLLSRTTPLHQIWCQQHLCTCQSRVWPCPRYPLLARQCCYLLHIVCWWSVKFIMKPFHMEN